MVVKVSLELSAYWIPWRSFYLNDFFGYPLNFLSNQAIL